MTKDEPAPLDLSIGYWAAIRTLRVYSEAHGGPEGLAVLLSVSAADPGSLPGDQAMWWCWLEAVDAVRTRHSADPAATEAALLAVMRAHAANRDDNMPRRTEAITQQEAYEAMYEWARAWWGDAPPTDAQEALAWIGAGLTDRDAAARSVWLPFTREARARLALEAAAALAKAARLATRKA